MAENSGAAAEVFDLPPRLSRLIAAATSRDGLGLTALALLFAVQINPWLRPSEDGCLYLQTVERPAEVDAVH